MAVDGELAAIIGGSVAGAVILIAITAVIVWLCCGKRRRKKDREQKKFQQLTPHTSPSHSQPSSLGHGNPPADPRLPKVGSNGLWLGTPGIYAGSPSPAYYYGRPGGKGPHPNSHLVQPAVLQRASSETRLPQRDRPVPGGPGIYAAGAGAGTGGGSHQRIYHSQQLASLTPLYEVVDPRNGSVYDVYQIGGGSKTKLLQDGGSGSGKHADRHSKGGGGKKAQRSHSDAAARDPAAKRPHRQKPPPQEGQRNSKTGSITKETAQVHQPKDQTKDKAGVENAAFLGSSEKIPEGKEASATDSMKLLANNRTDDQKKVVNPSSASSSDSDSKDPSPAPVPAPDPTLHYTYGGDIYAVPSKEDSKRRSRSENPILARMQDMILERPGGAHPGQVPDPVTDLSETAEPLIISSVYASPDQGASLIQNPIYQEVEEAGGVPEREAVRRAVSAAEDVDVTSEILATVQLAAEELDRDERKAGVDSDVVRDDAAATSAVMSVRDAGGSGVGGRGQEEGGGPGVVKPALDTRWSTDTEAATDEIRAGKHISVTAEAFEFLDKYLSDEEGGESHSPPKSPMSAGGDELMY